MLQTLEEELYIKINNALTKVNGRARIAMDLCDGRIAYVECIFKGMKDLEQKMKEKDLEKFIAFKRNWVKLENVPTIRFSYYNYLIDRYETRSEHPDYSFPGPYYSIRTATRRLNNCYGYLIATLKDEPTTNSVPS